VTSGANSRRGMVRREGGCGRAIYVLTREGGKNRYLTNKGTGNPWMVRLETGHGNDGEGFAAGKNEALKGQGEVSYLKGSRIMAA